MRDIAVAVTIISIIAGLTFSGIQEDKKEQALAVASANNLCDYTSTSSKIIIACKGARELKK